MPLTLMQRDLLAVVDSRSKAAMKVYPFASTPDPVKALRLAEMIESVLSMGDALGDLDDDTRQALQLTRQAADAYRQAASAHVATLEGSV